MDTLSNIMLFSFLILVSYFDLRYKKIYNWLTGSFFILALTKNIYIFGLSGMQLSFFGSLSGFVILLIPYAFGWIGGGDIKFLAAAGCFLGAGFIFKATLYGVILAGIAAFFYLLFRKQLKNLLSQLILVFFSPGSINTIESCGSLPFGFFLSLGILYNWIITWF